MKTAICIASLMCLAVLQPVAAEHTGPADTTLRIASITYKPVEWDKETNTRQLEKEIRKAARSGARVIVTPEGALEGYVVNVVRMATGEKREQLTVKFNQLAEPCDGPYIKHFQQLSNELDIWLVLGFLEADRGSTYNTAILIDPDGGISGKYRKTHFAQGYRNGTALKENPVGYTRGSDYPVFQVDSTKVGLMICYDRRVAKVARSLAENGAELIINPAYGIMGDKNRRFVADRAKENGVPVLFVHPRQTLFSDQNGEISTDIRPVEDAVHVLDITVPHKEKQHGLAERSGHDAGL